MRGLHTKMWERLAVLIVQPSRKPALKLTANLNYPGGIFFLLSSISFSAVTSHCAEETQKHSASFQHSMYLIWKSEACAFFVCITELDLSVTATVDTAFHLKWDWPSFQWQPLISLFSRCAGKNYTIEVYAILHISSALLCSRQELWAGMWVGKSQGCSARY